MKKLSLLVLLMALSGCAHVISEESRKLVNPAITFQQLRQNPDAFIGRYVMLGGIIAGTRNSKEGGQLEVVQFDLERDGTPQNAYSSGGRFLATTPAFLDDIVYRRGRLVTIVGEVKGKKTQPLDEVSYTYPVISIHEMHHWKQYDAEHQPYAYSYPPPPPYYNPYYFGHWPDIYWYRPLGPRLGH